MMSSPMHQPRSSSGSGSSHLLQPVSEMSLNGGDPAGSVDSRASPPSSILSQTDGQQFNPTLSALDLNGSGSGAPWTLGSTDGNYAISLLALEQQQLNNHSSPGAAIASQTGEAKAALLSSRKSLYHDRLFQQCAASVEAVLAAACEVMGFDIAEMWLRAGPKTHQLTNSHLRPTALEDSVRKDLVDVYYGDKSSERTHRLSPALCKRAKDAGDVVWVTSQDPSGADALKTSINNVRTAVAIPVCHEVSNTNITIIFFCMRR